MTAAAKRTKVARIPEKILKAGIKQLLELDGWHVFEMEPISRREWGKGTGELGQPDLLAIRYQGGDGMGDVLWIECKAKGGKAKPHQTAWHQMERARGGLVIVAGEDFATDPDGFFKWYAKSALMIKKIR